MALSRSTFELEKILAEKGFEFIIGTDEVGRGPLCGPVVACAVALRNNQISRNNFQTNPNIQNPIDQNGFPELNPPFPFDKNWDLVRDSKKLSEKQREKAFDFIHEHFYVGVGLCDHITIDRINILEASFLAMKKAISSLTREIQNSPNSPNKNPNNLKTKNQELKTIILVDGNKKIPNLSIEQMAVVGGDALVKSIAAASIIAKVTRDRMMEQFHQKYPQYGFEKHKGYGTKAHLEALTQHGPCEIHRKSFAPVKRLSD